MDATNVFDISLSISFDVFLCWLGYCSIWIGISFDWVQSHSISRRMVCILYSAAAVDTLAQSAILFVVPSPNRLIEGSWLLANCEYNSHANKHGGIQQSRNDLSYIASLLLWFRLCVSGG